MMKKKIIAAVMAALLVIAGVPFISGCSASAAYTLCEDDFGEKYYTVKCTGFTSALNGVLEIPETYGEGEDSAPVRVISREAFRGTNITELVIPASVKQIDMAAFANCGMLKKVTFAEGSPLTEISQGQFGYCNSLTEVILPQGLQKIGVYAFTGCKHLMNIELPQTLTEISSQAFSECEFLQSINLPEGLKTIGERAFYMSGLTEITVPSSVKDVTVTTENDKGEEVSEVRYGLGVGAFWCCESLKTAKIYAEIETITSSVFGYCTQLEEIYLPTTLKKIDGAKYVDGAFYCGHAFHNDPALKKVYFAGSEAEWQSVEVVANSVTIGGETSDNLAILNAAKTYNANY
ncbi:MAG: leucine-rich repeat domain-containing protein [Clostridia bacterium]|nr:leucine-rich repeat domain-containing protein [Clostridia bacterium]